MMTRSQKQRVHRCRQDVGRHYEGIFRRISALKSCLGGISALIKHLRVRRYRKPKFR